MKSRDDRSFQSFIQYEWMRGFQANRYAAGYENAVLARNGMFFMLVVDAFLFFFYGVLAGSCAESRRYAIAFPIILLFYLGTRWMYEHFEHRKFMTVAPIYILGTLILGFCSYMILEPSVQASFYAFFLVTTILTTLVVDIPQRKLAVLVIWLLMMAFDVFHNGYDVAKQQSVLIHGAIVGICSFLFGCFLSWRRLQGFDAAAQLLYISTHDRLTGLKNREKLYSDYDAWTAEQKITGVLIFDINSFKHLNDTYGHVFGDEAIQYVAGILQLCEERYGISFYRYGGDEFVGLVLTDSEREPERLIPHIKHRVSESQLCTIDGVEITIRISGGYANYQPGISLEQSVNAADEVMYADKEQMKKDGLVSTEVREKYNS